MKQRRKTDLPVAKVRRFLEPGPVVLVSSSYRGRDNIMTLGWHMIMMDDPSLVGCFIWDQNDSYEMIRRSKECVINVPTEDMIRKAIRIGNTHGSEMNKFAELGLTSVPAKKVAAPLIDECFANFECKLSDTRLINRYSIFVFKVVKAHVARSPRYSVTIHYRGGGVFMIAGKNRSYRRLFKPQNL